MCLPVAAVMAVTAATAVAQQASSNHDLAKAEGQRADAARLQAQQYIIQNNMNQNMANLANRDAYEKAVQEMTASNLQGYQNLSAIDNAISESGLKGRSVDRACREVQADIQNNALNIDNEYKRNYSEIFGQKLTSQQNAAANIQALDQDAHKQSGWGMVLGYTNAGIGGAMTGYQMGNALKDAMPSAGANKASAGAGSKTSTNSLR